MGDENQETKLVFCNTCKVFTSHILRAKYARPAQNYDAGYVSGNYENRASIWTCAGCDEVTFERQKIELIEDGEEWGDYLPSRQQEDVQQKFFRKLSPELKQLYEEVIAGFNAGHLLLCTIGLRALIEGICREKGLEGNLEHMVDGLVKYLPSLNLIEALHAFRVVGNDAVHRLAALSRDDARAAIEIMEDLLNFLYDLDYRASRVKRDSKKVTLIAPNSGPVN